MLMLLFDLCTAFVHAPARPPRPGDSSQEPPPHVQWFSCIWAQRFLTLFAFGVAQGLDHRAKDWCKTVPKNPLVYCMWMNREINSSRLIRMQALTVDDSCTSSIDSSKSFTKAMPRATSISPESSEGFQRHRAGNHRDRGTSAERLVNNGPSALTIT